MAIYKLNELYSSKPEYGVGAAAQNSGSYKYVRQADIESKQFPTFVNDGPILYNDDVLISRAGANSGASYIHDAGAGYVFAGFLVRYNFNKSKLLNKYFYYWTKSSYYINQIAGVSKSGSTMPKLNPPVVGSLTINLPTLEIQQEIIEIIKPIENCIFNIQKQIIEVKKLLISNYEICNGNRVAFPEVVRLVNKKYNNQLNYLATNAIGEMSVDISKVQDISKKKPSRANLTPEKNSIIFSKLDGENKLLYIDGNFEYVVSTGFFNITTKYMDHVIGYILSADFQKQKSLLATGTTMVGITSTSLSKMQISEPIEESNRLVTTLNHLINLELSLKQELEKCIFLLIK